MSQLNYTVKHSVANDKILIELHSKFGEYETVLSRTVVDTQDKIIRENLIKLGWTPPGGSGIVSTAYHDSIVQSAVKAHVEETNKLRDELTRLRTVEEKFKQSPMWDVLAIIQTRNNWETCAKKAEAENAILLRYVESLQEVCDSHQILQAGLLCKQREKKNENSSK